MYASHYRRCTSDSVPLSDICTTTCQLLSQTFCYILLMETVCNAIKLSSIISEGAVTPVVCINRASLFLPPLVPPNRKIGNRFENKSNITLSSSKFDVTTLYFVDFFFTPKQSHAIICWPNFPSKLCFLKNYFATVFVKRPNLGHRNHISTQFSQNSGISLHLQSNSFFSYPFPYNINKVLNCML